MSTYKIGKDVSALELRVDELEKKLNQISPPAPSVYTASLLQSGSLNVMGWSEWDYQDLPISKTGQEIIIPTSTKLIGFDYYEHPGDAMSNIRLVYKEGDDTKETSYSGEIYGGEIIERKSFPEDPTLKVVGVNTRIWYGYAMSDIQFIYTYGPNNEYGGTTDWCRPQWPYNESFTLRCSSEWELDGVRVGIHHGDAMAAIKIHTRKL